MSTAWDAIEASTPNDNTAMTHAEFNAFIKKFNAAMRALVVGLGK
jgi:hypothetical protein